MRSVSQLPPRVRAFLATVAVVALTIVLGACDSAPDQRAQDAARSSQSVERIIAQQPVQSGNYSPTRATINGWVQTWMTRPGVKYYAYLYTNGQPLGYYVLQGPPVSYAAGATEPYRRQCDGSGCFDRANPGQDAAFANVGSGQFQFYGMDAQTSRIVEWGGVGVTYIGSSAPLNVPGAVPLGDAK